MTAAAETTSGAAAGPSVWRRMLGSGRLVFGAAILLALIVCAVGAPWIAPFDPNEQDLLNALKTPFWTDGAAEGHWLGTDNLGRDTLSRLIYGTRVALFVAVCAAVGTMVAGTILAVTIRRDPDGRGWHDRLAGTRVLSASTPPAAGFSKVWLAVFFVFQAVALTWLIQSTSSISDDLWVGLDVIFTLIVWIVVDLVWVIVWTAQSRKQSSR